MPLLFSYGTLQDERVQLATFGRRVDGRRDELPQFEPSLVAIEDPQMARTLGRTHNANVTWNGDAAKRVEGTALEVTQSELTAADRYEAPFRYQRIEVTLASGRKAFVYLHR